jgi:aryl-alcohol dehydrogenase-like predicted oxidoreductase
MDTRQLGATDLNITRIGFGAWAIGGPDYAFGWGAQDDNESVAAIHKALDAGINWIDTAPVYGLGRSERVVARALKERGRVNRPYVFTKCSLRWDSNRTISHSLKAGSIREEVDQSLQRLEVDVIDLLQIHWPAMPASSPAPDVEEGWGTLLELRREGKVRHIGVSNFHVSHLERACGIATPASLQPVYSLIKRGIEADTLPYCLSKGIGTIVYSPMGAGLLSGTMTRERASALPPNDWRSRAREFQEPTLGRALALVEVLRGIGRRHDATPGAIAVAWTLRHPAVTGAIVGFRHPRQVDDVVRAGSIELSEQDLQEIRTSL